LIKDIKLIYWTIKNVGLAALIINIIYNIIIDKEKKILITHFTSKIVGQKNLFFHKDISTLSSLALSISCYIQANNKVFLGKNILIGPGIKIISSNHNSLNREFIKTTPIYIGDNVWIGANAIILPGVKIGSNNIIGAGSVVTKSFTQEHIIIAGNPAKIIKHA